MGFKLYADRDYLYTEYVVKKRKCADIAKDNSVTEMTIYNWCKEHDLLKYRGKGRNLGSRIIKSGRTRY